MSFHDKNIPMRTWFLLFGVFLIGFLTTNIPRNYLLHSPDYIRNQFPLEVSQISIKLVEDVDFSVIYDELKSNNIGISREIFDWALHLSGWKKVPKGHYIINTERGLEELFNKLGRGIQDPIYLTILPGLEQRSLLRSLANQTIHTVEDFEQTLKNVAFLKKEQTDTTMILGMLSPNTYEVYWTSTPEQIIARLILESNKQKNELLSRVDTLHYSWNEYLIMASIIEWEYKFEEEKKRISGLYWNRIERGMRLQADPTVNYALGERRRLLYRDYSYEHPYNTYLHKGLPPGPITNPSYSSIMAAMTPEEHTYLYMVANPEGTHTFTTNYSDHQKAAKVWQDWIQEQYRIKRRNETNQ